LIAKIEALSLEEVLSGVRGLKPNQTLETAFPGRPEYCTGAAQASSSQHRLQLKLRLCSIACGSLPSFSPLRLFLFASFVPAFVHRSPLAPPCSFSSHFASPPIFLLAGVLV